MTQKTFNEISVPQAKSIYKAGSYINEELILFDKFEDVPLPTDARRMNGIFVALCLKGQAQYTVDTIKYQVKQNDVIIISSGQVVGDYMLSPDCKGIAFMSSSMFTNEIIEGIKDLSALFLFSKNHPVFNLDAEDAKTFKYYFNLIKSKVDNEGHYYRKELVGSLFKSMLYDLGNEIWKIRNGNETTKSRSELIFAEFIKLVEQNFKKERKVSWYSKTMCLTQKYLTQSIKNISHQTPSEWIDRYVTLEISVQLKNTGKSIKEIAQELNFPNQSFFGKFFKERMGVSPKEYRSR